MTKTLTTKDLRIRGEWAGVPVAVQDELARQYGAHHATSITWLWGMEKVKPRVGTTDLLVVNAKTAILDNPDLLKHAHGLDKALGVDS